MDAKLTCAQREQRRRRAQWPSSASVTLPFAGEEGGVKVLQHRRRAQNRSQPLGRIPGKARSDLPSLARVELHRQPISPLRRIGPGAAPRQGTRWSSARADLPASERESHPRVLQARNGSGRSLPPLLKLSPKTMRGPADTQGCTRPVPQPQSSTRRGRARRLQNRPGQ